MINKISCLIGKHKIEETFCPYTKITYKQCIRCHPKHTRVSKFN